MRVDRADFLTIKGDPVRLAQVFANLLTNAAKFTPPRGKIDVAIERLSARVRVTVRDNGRGIARDQLDRIFEPFGQVDRERDALGGGLGLGLAIVSNLVQRLGGSILAESDGPAREGYLLLKLIGYHPQPAADVQRPGVAAHVDFSWVTLTLQDSPGLEICHPGGDWALVDPVPGGLWVHPGELLQVASRGAFPATPHRVINPSLARTRVSLPLFLNPPLTARVEPLIPAATAPSAEDVPPAPHVHRVLPPDAPPRPLHFGEAEWQRKGRNAWCHLCAPPWARA